MMALNRPWLRPGIVRLSLLLCLVLTCCAGADAIAAHAAERTEARGPVVAATARDASTADAASDAAEDVVVKGDITLLPGLSVDNMSLRPGDSMYFRIGGLEQGAQYEVRISYSATTPADFLMRLHAHVGRSLTNIEKVIFNTREPGSAQAFMEGYLEVTAFYAGYTDIAAVAARAIPFNIVVERLYYGAPLEAFKLGAIAACLVCAAVVVSARVDVFLRFVLSANGTPVAISHYRKSPPVSPRSPVNSGRRVL